MNKKSVFSKRRLVKTSILATTLFIATMLLFSSMAVAGEEKAQRIPTDTTKGGISIYSEDFESVITPGFPAGWGVEDTNTDANTWYTASYSGNFGPYNARYGYSYSNPGNDWAFMPGLVLHPGITYELTFFYKASSTYGTESMDVYIGGAQASGSMTTMLWDNPDLEKVYTQAVVSFTVGSSGTYYIGFHSYSIPNQYWIYLDDIEVTYPPADDVGVTNINEPTGTFPAIPPNTKTIKVQVENFGTNAQTGVPVYCEVYSLSGMILNENMDSDPGWATTGCWAFGAPSAHNTYDGSVNSGTNVYGTGLASDYPLYADDTLTTPVIDLTTATTSASIDYYMWYDTESTTFDGIDFQIAVDGGAFSDIVLYGGHVQKYWEHITYDLSTYIGHTIEIRWHVYSDSSITYPGAFIDDVQVYADFTATLEQTVSATTNLAVSESKEVILSPDWDIVASGGGGYYHLEAYTAMTSPSDEDSSNDYAFADVLAAEAEHDVGVAVITAPIPGLKDVAFSEDFEGGIVPPAGWTLDASGNPYTWEIDSYDPHEGTYCASCFYDDTYSSVQDEWLISPSFSLATFTDAELAFGFLGSYYWSVDPYDNYDLNVYASDDGGSNWDLLWNEADEGLWTNWVWYDIAIDISAYAGEANVMVAFQYNGYDGAQFSIDMVEVTGTMVLPPSDAGPTEMKCIVENYGDFIEDLDTFPTDCVFAEVHEVTTKAMVYQESDVSITNLGIGADIEITFPDWIATGGDYRIDMYTVLTGDADSTNNLKSIFITINAPPEISNPRPYDGEAGVILNPTLMVDVFDPDGDDVTVEFFFDGGSIGTTFVAGGSGTALGFPGEIEKGCYDWYVTANDGVLTTSPTWSFCTAGVEAPTIQIVSPNNGATLAGTVDVLWWAADSDDPNLGIYIYYKEDGATLWNRITVLPLENDGEFSWNTASLADGTYALKVEAFNKYHVIAFDTALNLKVGNGLSGSMVSSIIITDTSIGSSQYVKNGDNLEIMAGITSGQSLSREDVTADLSGFGMGANVIADSYDGYTATWIITNAACSPSDGSVSITITAEDNQGSATITADNTKPEISIANPETGFYFLGKRFLPLSRTIIMGKITIEVDTVDASGISQVSYYIDGDLAATFSDGSFDWYTNLPRGSHTLKAVVYDQVGNSNVGEMTFLKLL